MLQNGRLRSSFYFITTLNIYYFNITNNEDKRKGP